jgi:Ca2+-binding RTX toxin-like protein
MASVNWGEIARSGFDAFGNFQGGWEIGSPSEGGGYETFTNILNFAGQVAPTLGPAGAAFGIGLNQAAAANNTVSAINKFNNGTMQPSDVLQVTGAVLGGLAAAAVILGGSVPIGIAATIAIIGLAGGPFAKDAVNEAIRALNDQVHGGDDTYDNSSGGAGGSLGGNGAAGAIGFGGADAAADATQPPPVRDPLVLDLDGDGIETTSPLDGNGIVFDHDDDGVKTGTGWIKPDDGWLVMDRDGNGTIDSGRELFGVDTIKSNGQTATDGFDALRDLDANNDGKIDASDGMFANLRIWRDLNQDGICQANELSTLLDNYITSISVIPKNVRIDLGNGNIQTGEGTFTRSDGTNGSTGTTTGKASNLDLVVDTFRREFIDKIPLTDQAELLPGLRGSGRVRDLSEAISLSTDLGDWVQTYIGYTSRQDQINAMDGFIEKWANTSDMKSLKEQADALAGSGVELTYHFGGLTKGTTAYDDFLRKLSIVERFMGFTYGGTSGQPRYTLLNAESGSIRVTLGSEQVANISLAYDRFKMDIYESLLLQTRLSSYFDKLDITLTGGQVVLAFQPLETAFKSAIAANPREGIIDLIEFLSAAGETRLKNLNWNATDFLISQISNLPDLGAFTEELSSWTVRFAASTEHKLTGTVRSDILLGTAGADLLYGGLGDDVLIGKGGTDVLEGGSGNDILDGGTGNDILNGGSGDDIYVFNKGSGADTIIEQSSTTQDILRLGNGLEMTDTLVERIGNSMRLSWGNGDSVLLQDYFSSTSYRVERIEFADGTVWGIEELMPRLIQQGTSGKDTIWGVSDYANRIDGLDGDDKLYGGNLDDVLEGGVGNDTLEGRSGNDILDGGTGNDILNGGSGDDIYVFNKGSGADTIIEQSSTTQDILRLGNGLEMTDTLVERIGNSMRLSWGNGDSVLLQDYFSSTSYRVERIEFADGTVWGIEELMPRLIQQGTSGKDTIWGVSDYANRIDGLDGDDKLYGGNLDDVLEGGVGSDTLEGRSGNDILDGGAGNDALNGGTGNDTYLFGKGAGFDIVNNSGSGSADNDRIVIGAGVSEDQIWFERIGNDLQLTLFETNDKLLVSNWYSGSSYRIDGIDLGNGKHLLEGQVDALVSAMAAFAPPASGQTTLPPNYQTVLNPIIATNWQ